MRRGAKRAKAKVNAKPPVARKSLKNESSRIRGLEKRLAKRTAPIDTNLGVP
jgi:hypothetical protein